MDKETPYIVEVPLGVVSDYYLTYVFIISITNIIEKQLTLIPIFFLFLYL